MVKASHTNTGLLLCVSLVATITLPVKAEPSSQGELVSQLSGHQTYQNQPQLNFNDYYYGRVRGMSGEIAAIELMKPIREGDGKLNFAFQPITIDGKEVNSVLVSVPYYVRPGNDVILKWQDGSWMIVNTFRGSFYGTLADQAYPYWISRLNLIEVSEVQRTAINWGETRTVGLPPLQPGTVAIETTPEPIVQPVRGLW